MTREQEDKRRKEIMQEIKEKILTDIKNYTIQYEDFLDFGAIIDVYYDTIDSMY